MIPLYWGIFIWYLSFSTNFHYGLWHNSNDRNYLCGLWFAQLAHLKDNVVYKIIIKKLIDIKKATSSFVDTLFYNSHLTSHEG